VYYSIFESEDYCHYEDSFAVLITNTYICKVIGEGCLRDLFGGFQMIPIKLICCHWSVFDCRTIIILSVDEAFISGLLECVEYLILLWAVHTAGPSQYKHVGCTG